MSVSRARYYKIPKLAEQGFDSLRYPALSNILVCIRSSHVLSISSIFFSTVEGLLKFSYLIA